MFLSFHADTYTYKTSPALDLSQLPNFPVHFYYYTLCLPLYLLIKLANKKKNRFSISISVVSRRTPLHPTYKNLFQTSSFASLISLLCHSQHIQRNNQSSQKTFAQRLAQKCGPGVTPLLLFSPVPLDDIADVIPS